MKQSMFGQYCSFVVNPFKRIQHIRRILSKGFDTFDSSKPLKNIPNNCTNYFTKIEIICCMILFKYMLSYFNMHSLHMDSRQCLCLLHSTAHPFLLELNQSSSSAMNPKKCVALLPRLSRKTSRGPTVNFVVSVLICGWHRRRCLKCSRLLSDTKSQWGQANILI